MIRAVIFDWGGVLIFNPAKEFWNYCASNIGVYLSKFIKVYKKYEKTYQKNQISEKELWRVVCSELRVPIPKNKSLWSKAAENVFKENKDVTDIALKIKQNGYKIGLLSNTEIPVARSYKKQPYNFFDTAVFSCFVGCVKPEREIYEIILRKMRVKPEEVIFIDDNKENIEAANSMRMKTIHFTSTTKMKKALNSYNVIL